MSEWNRLCFPQLKQISSSLSTGYMLHVARASYPWPNATYHDNPGRKKDWKERGRSVLKFLLIKVCVLLANQRNWLSSWDRCSIAPTEGKEPDITTPTILVRTLRRVHEPISARLMKTLPHCQRPCPSTTLSLCFVNCIWRPACFLLSRSLPNALWCETTNVCNSKNSLYSYLCSLKVRSMLLGLAYANCSGIFSPSNVAAMDFIWEPVQAKW